MQLGVNCLFPKEITKNSVVSKTRQKKQKQNYVFKSDKVLESF